MATPLAPELSRLVGDCVRPSMTAGEIRSAISVALFKGDVLRLRYNIEEPGPEVAQICRAPVSLGRADPPIAVVSFDLNWLQRQQPWPITCLEASMLLSIACGMAGVSTPLARLSGGRTCSVVPVGHERAGSLILNHHWICWEAKHPGAQLDLDSDQVWDPSLRLPDHSHPQGRPFADYVRGLYVDELPKVEAFAPEVTIIS